MQSPSRLVTGSIVIERGDEELIISFRARATKDLETRQLYIDEETQVDHKDIILTPEEIVKRDDMLHDQALAYWPRLNLYNAQKDLDPDA